MKLSFVASLDLTQPTIAGICVFAFALVYLRARATWNTRSRSLPLPPGPKPLPIIGNMLDWPKSSQWLAFRDMCAKYGNVFHFSIFGKHMVFLGSPDAIFELLDKRSANTSDRFQSPLHFLSGMDTFNLAGMRYGQKWRQHRRPFWQHFHPTALHAYLPFQRRAAHRFLNKLLKTPYKLREHVRFTFTASILRVLYGIDVADDEDKWVAIVEAALEWTGEAFTPGKYLVEMFPILRHIPPWVPFATVQRLSVHWRATNIRLKEEPYQHVKMEMATGEGADCAVSQMISRMVGDDDGTSTMEAEDIIKSVAAVAVEGGADTMFSTVQSFFIAMSLFPEVQSKAQAELDAVVGPNRLPDFGDRDALVYVNAVIKEALRWQNVTPFALPHMTVEDDEFRGYFIPAGTSIFPNVWACMHDPDVYGDPDVFRPERFIRDGKLDFSSARDPANFVFGFGRRICPGRFFAENGLFINVASVLYVFNITPPLDENGEVIKIELRMTDGLLCYPVDCRCTIKPRSANAELLIRQAQLIE